MNTNKLLRYIALGLGLLYSLLMILMAMDSYPVNGTLKEFEGFLYHISPGIIIIIASIYGCIRPKFGRYLFFVIACVFTWYYETYKNISSFMGVTFPLVVITIILLFASLSQKDK
jgi:hypothetical protein